MWVVDNFGSILPILLIVCNEYLLDKVFCEWIDLPHFSDQERKYGAPIKLDKNKQDQRIHSVLGFRPNSSPNIEGIPELKNVSNRSPNNWIPFPFTEEPVIKKPMEFVTEAPAPMLISIGSNDDDDDGVVIEIEDDPSPNNPEESENHESPPASTISPQPDSVESTEIPVDDKNSNTGEKKSKWRSLLDYLPMKLIRAVHNSLISTPKTMEGKLMYLKNFEVNLVNEINRRISNIFPSKKSKRETRSEMWQPVHEHEVHEHHEHGHGDEMSFPSVEGSLLAISFLTFAAYLVKLVMLLFQLKEKKASMMETNMMQMTMMPALFGRVKRSTNVYDKDTEKVLQYTSAEIWKKIKNRK